MLFFHPQIFFQLGLDFLAGLVRHIIVVTGEETRPWGNHYNGADLSPVFFTGGSVIKVHAGISFLGNDLALTNTGNRDGKSEPAALILEYCRGGCLDRDTQQQAYCQ